MSRRTNALGGIERFVDRLNSQFGDVADIRDAQGPIGVWGGVDRIPVDLLERADAFVVLVDLPGYGADDVELRLTGRTLHIEVDREPGDDQDGEYLRHERRKRPTSRSVTLPTAVDQTSVNATMEDGVLTVTVPKREAEESREIEIE